MSTLRKNVLKKASSNAAKLCEVDDGHDYLRSVGLIHPDVRESYPNLFFEAVKLRNKEKQEVASNTSSNTNLSQSTQRLTRSKSSREPSLPKYRPEDFANFSDSYKYNKHYYDSKVQSVLEDFEYSETADTGKGRRAYTYLLVDTRGGRKKNLDEFCNSVLYVGKGIDDRAYTHFGETKKFIEGEMSKNDKLARKIKNVWDDGGEVEVLRVAENLVKDEALTREDLLIERLGFRQLGNNVRSTSYGKATTMKPADRAEVADTMLFTAMKQYNKVDPVSLRRGVKKS